METNPHIEAGETRESDGRPGRGGRPGGRRGGGPGTTRVAKDAGGFLLGDLLDRALGFAFLLLATKLYGVAMYGLYVVALAVFQLVRVVVSFGLGRSIVKDTAAAAALEDWSRVKGTLVLGFALCMGLSAVAAVVLVAGAGPIAALAFPNQPEIVPALRVFGILTPVFAVNFVLLQAFYGLGRIRRMVVANNVVEPAARLAALAALWAGGVSGLVAMPLAYLTALAVSSLYALAHFRRDVWRPLKGVTAAMRVRETLAFAVPVTLNDLATRGFRSFNTYLLALFRTNAEVGLFSVAFKLTGVVFAFSGSLTGAFRPRAAALLAAGDRDQLGRESRAMTRWILSFAALPYGLLIFFPEPILRAVGPQFTPAARAISIFCCGLLLAQGAGPIAALLMMAGRSKPVLYFMVVASAVYAILSLAWIPDYGMVGAASAATATLALFVPIASAYTQRTLGIRIYGASMWKPLAAGAAAVGAAFLVASVAPGRRFVDAGLVCGTATLVYVGLLWLFGAEAEERVLLDAVLAKAKRKLGRGRG